MRRYLLIDMYAHSVVIIIPNTITAAATMIILSGDTIASSSGSYFTAVYASAVRMALATAPESIPIHRFLVMNGRRMKLQLAPTSFMVCIRNLLEYIVRRMVLFISEKDNLSSADFCLLTPADSEGNSLPVYFYWSSVPFLSILCCLDWYIRHLVLSLLKH